MVVDLAIDDTTQGWSICCFGLLTYQDFKNGRENNLKMRDTSCKAIIMILNETSLQEKDFFWFYTEGVKAVESPTNWPSSAASCNACLFVNRFSLDWISGAMLLLTSLTAVRNRSLCLCLRAKHPSRQPWIGERTTRLSFSSRMKAHKMRTNTHRHFEDPGGLLFLVQFPSVHTCQNSRMMRFNNIDSYL